MPILVVEHVLPVPPRSGIEGGLVGVVAGGMAESEQLLIAPHVARQLTRALSGDQVTPTSSRLLPLGLGAEVTAGPLTERPCGTPRHAAGRVIGLVGHAQGRRAPETQPIGELVAQALADAGGVP